MVVFLITYQLGDIGTRFSASRILSYLFQTLGQSMRTSDKRMTAERCAHLILVGAANELTECWIANFPILPIFYATQYFPGLTNK